MSANTGLEQLHTDQLLRKHQLSLACNEEREWLVDWMTFRRVQAYLTDLEREPGFPGVETAARLKREHCSR
jgi:hypothetical protein